MFPLSASTSMLPVPPASDATASYAGCGGGTGDACASASGGGRRAGAYSGPDRRQTAIFSDDCTRSVDTPDGHQPVIFSDTYTQSVDARDRHQSVIFGYGSARSVDEPDGSSLLRAADAASGDPSLIFSAQSSAYWTGRFSASNDRRLNETQLDETAMRKRFESKQDLRPKGNGQVPRAGIPRSYTTAALTTLPVVGQPFLSQISVSNPIATGAVNPSTGCYAEQQAGEEEARYLQIFDHLRQKCMTDEALDSLWHWQQEFARKFHKPQFLPVGGTMERSTGMRIRNILKGSGLSVAGRRRDSREKLTVIEATASRELGVLPGHPGGMNAKRPGLLKAFKTMH